MKTMKIRGNNKDKTSKTEESKNGISSSFFKRYNTIRDAKDNNEEDCMSVYLFDYEDIQNSKKRPVKSDMCFNADYLNGCDVPAITIPEVKN